MVFGTAMSRKVLTSTMRDDIDSVFFLLYPTDFIKIFVAFCNIFDIADEKKKKIQKCYFWRE